MRENHKMYGSYNHAELNQSFWPGGRVWVHNMKHCLWLRFSWKHLSMEAWNSYPMSAGMARMTNIMLYKTKDFRWDICSLLFKICKTSKNNSMSTLSRPEITRMFVHSSFFFPRTLTLREIPPFHSFSTVLFISLALPVTTTSNAPWGTWNNLGQCLRKPHYFLYSSSPWTIFVCGGILFWKIVPPISDQLSCGVRWGNSTGVWPPEELPAKS